MTMKLTINRKNKLNHLFNQSKSHIVMKPKKLMKNLLTMMKIMMNLPLMIMKKKMIRFFNLRIMPWLLIIMTKNIAQSSSKTKSENKMRLLKKKSRLIMTLQ